MKTDLLVVANRTAASPGLLAHLRERAERCAGGARIHLLVPPTAPGPGGRGEARRNLEEALAHMTAAGLEADGRVGTDTDLVIAVLEAYDPALHDEIVLSTLPASVSHWLRVDGPARIGRATGAIVRHVVTAPERPAPRVVHLEREPGPGVLAPLVAMAHGGRPRD